MSQSWYVKLPSGEYVNLGAAHAVRPINDDDPKYRGVKVVMDSLQTGQVYFGADAGAIIAALEAAGRPHVIFNVD